MSCRIKASNIHIPSTVEQLSGSSYHASFSGQVLQAHVNCYSCSMLQGASRSQGQQLTPDFSVYADHPDDVSQLAALFQERPAWSQASLSEKLPDCPAQILQQLLLSQQCYIFRNGERCLSSDDKPIIQP